MSRCSQSSYPADNRKRGSKTRRTAKVRLAELPSNNGGGTWNSEGVMLVATQATKGIQRLPASGGLPSAVTTLADSEIAHRFPFFLPDGRHFIFQVQVADRTQWAVHVGSLDSSEHKFLIQAEYAQFARPNFLLFQRDDALLAQPLDLNKYALVGEPVLISKSLLPSNVSNGRASFAVSQSGVVVYAAGQDFQAQAADRQLLWVDREGKRSAPVGDPIQGGLRLSPDGKRVAIAEQTGANGLDIRIIDLERGIKIPLTTHAGNDTSPVWSPDGSRLVFSTNRDKKGQALYVKNSDAAVAEQLLLESEQESNQFAFDQSLDGRWIVFARARGGSRDLWALPLSGDKKPFPYLTSTFDETAASLSPNGRFLAYTSNELGTYEVIVQSFPDAAGGKWQISTNGGYFPRWRRDGKELYYLEPGAGIVAVAVITDGKFEVGKTVNITEVPLGIPDNAGTTSLFAYDVSADGQRFLVSVPRGNLRQGRGRPLTVVVNWPAGLK
jgi:Tol biopolymer transport system component